MTPPTSNNNAPTVIDLRLLWNWYCRYFDAKLHF